MRANMPSAIQKKLIELYKQMAQDGYVTREGQHIEAAFNDMEIRAFKEFVKPLFEKFAVKTLLDYGCGGSDYNKTGFKLDLSAKEYFRLNDVYLFEPARGIDERRSADAVVCFDVLEHIFIYDLPETIRELFRLSKRLLIVNVACYNARALLPNGENAHITVRPPHWWKGMFDTISVEFPDVSVQLWCSTGWRKVDSFNVVRSQDWLDSNCFTVPLS